jgi:hypothetical protein
VCVCVCGGGGGGGGKVNRARTGSTVPLLGSHRFATANGRSCLCLHVSTGLRQQVRRWKGMFAGLAIGLQGLR